MIRIGEKMKLRVLESKNINILSLFSSSYKSSKLFTLPNRLQYDLIEKLGYTHCGSVAKLCLTLWGSMGCSMPVSLSFTVSQSLLKLMSVKSVMPANHLFFCCSLHLPPSIFPSISVFSELALPIRWPKYWKSRFNISPSNEYSGLICFRIDWFDLPVLEISYFSKRACYLCYHMRVHYY